MCWQVLDKYKIAESKMRPWIQKKLIEYLGIYALLVYEALSY